jgi:hypothetical protein
MRAVITVFTREFEGKDHVRSRLAELAEDVKIESDNMFFQQNPESLLTC